ncbi:MAG TPA: EVE domain-containing protein [Candidatus Atribacteria bacterium]|nr:EVE domain-containing protein [Candidatus Atribacteria bacterium]
MPRYRIFKVDDGTWPEHDSVGIAAINDPHVRPTQQSIAQRQSAIAEISGIRPGDIIFFNLMASDNHPPQIVGIFKAVSKPYYNPDPLYPEARYIKEEFPFRIDFECVTYYPEPVNFSEIWALRDKGKIWLLQQSRGDAVGRHACVGITKIEAKLIERLLKMNNIKTRTKSYNTSSIVINRQPLPLDFREDRPSVLHYEAVLQSLILEGLADGKYKDIFGEYDDFIPNALTGTGKEIDILILKYNGDDILWYEILELKQNKFTMEELQKLIVYEKEIIQSRAENPLQVYLIAVAAKFDEEVKRFVKGREDYKERPIRLVKYAFNSQTKDLQLVEVSP